MAERHWNQELGEPVGEPTMAQWEWEAYCDRHIAAARKAQAISDGTVHVEHLAVHDRVAEHMAAHECDYAGALDAVLADAPAISPEPVRVDADSAALNQQVMAFVADHDVSYGQALERCWRTSARGQLHDLGRRRRAIRVAPPGRRVQRRRSADNRPAPANPPGRGGWLYPRLERAAADGRGRLAPEPFRPDRETLMDDHRRAETVAHLQGATEACHLRPELVAELRRLYDAWPAAVGLTVHELLEVAEREGLC